MFSIQEVLLNLFDNSCILIYNSQISFDMTIYKFQPWTEMFILYSCFYYSMPDIKNVHPSEGAIEYCRLCLQVESRKHRFVILVCVLQ